MIKTVLVALDGSGHGNRALTAGADLAGKYGAKLLILTVLPDGRVPLELYEYLRTEGLYLGEVTERLLSQAEATAKSCGATNIECQEKEGDPAEAILQVAEDRAADLIVMGSRGLGTVAELLLGSVSQKVIHLAKAPCMIVR